MSRKTLGKLFKHALRKSSGLPHGRARAMLLSALRASAWEIPELGQMADRLERLCERPRRKEKRA